MPKSGMKKRGGDDAQQAGSGAGMDPVAIEVHEREKVEDFHNPHRAE